jgi:hypothetical protein
LEVNAMYANHPGQSEWTAQRLMVEIDQACLILASEVAHGLHRLGFHHAADWLTPLGGPIGPHASARV